MMMVILRKEDRVGHSVYDIRIPGVVNVTVVKERGGGVQNGVVVAVPSGPGILLADTNTSSVFKPLTGATTPETNAHRKSL